MILSIIIPVYNTEKYVGKCIQSCIDQNFSFDDFEILLIDDGSTDNSPLILADYSSRFSNIKVLTQINSKQGAARNKGLTIAKGKYVWFVDSDDWLEKNIFKIIIEKCESFDLDILRVDAYNIYENKSIKRNCYHSINKIYHGSEFFLEDKFSECVPFHIFKKKFLLENDFYFKENMFYEDSEFLLRVFEKCKKFYYYSLYSYNVRIRFNSTTRTINYENKFDIIQLIKYQVAYVNTNHLHMACRLVYEKHISSNMNTLLIEVSPNKKFFLKGVNELLQISSLNNIISNSSYKYKIEYFLLKYPNILFLVINIYVFFKSKNS